MNYLGIDYSVKNMPALDPGFIPFGIWAKAYLQEADRPFRIAVERLSLIHISPGRSA